MSKEQLTIKELAPYLPYGLKVQYEGITNGKEISLWNKENNNFTFEDIEGKPEEVRGLKMGRIRRVEMCLNFTKYHIGGKGCQVHYNTDRFKPLLRPLSDLTKEIEVNGERFVPILRLNEEMPNTPNFDYLWNMGIHQYKNLSETNIEWCIIKRLYEWHFAVDIPENLYIDINTITNG